MKVGEGAGICLADIAAGVPTATIRARFADGTYGTPPNRPRGEFVKAWLQADGRSDIIERKAA